MMKILVWASLGASLMLLCAGCWRNELPLRSECIVEVILQWKEGVSIQERARASMVMQASVSEANAKGQLSFRPNVALPGSDLDRVYLQFHERCEDKRTLAYDFMSVAAQDLSEVLVYTISPRVIAPGADTIDTGGLNWRD